MKAKKVISLFVTFLLTTSLVVPAFAKDTTKVLPNGYTERVDSEGVIHRSINRQTNVTASEASFENIKNELVALGMDAMAVENLTLDQLETFDSSISLYSTTEYTKTTPDGLTVKVPESVALAEANRAASAQAEKSSPAVDDYRKVTHIAADLGDGYFAFSTNAWWLTQPGVRSIDSIGSCAMNCARIPGTETGYLRYTRERFNSAGQVTSKTTLSPAFDEDRFSGVTSGNFHGVGATFDLPHDIPGEERYSDFYAFFYYKGSVNSPSIAQNFNSIGTYTHTTITFSADPSLSIAFSPKVDVSAAIGISVALGKDDTSAEIYVEYRP